VEGVEVALTTRLAVNLLSGNRGEASRSFRNGRSG
jgi:hypothetical protein